MKTRNNSLITNLNKKRLVIGVYELIYLVSWFAMCFWNNSIDLFSFFLSLTSHQGIDSEMSGKYRGTNN